MSSIGTNAAVGEATSFTEVSKRSERMSGEGSSSTEATTNAAVEVARSSAEVAARPPDTGARGGGRRQDEKEVVKFCLSISCQSCALAQQELSREHFS
jgi:hypothetical protein